MTAVGGREVRVSREPRQQSEISSHDLFFQTQHVEYLHAIEHGTELFPLTSGQNNRTKFTIKHRPDQLNAVYIYIYIYVTSTAPPARRKPQHTILVCSTSVLYCCVLLYYRRANPPQAKMAFGFEITNVRGGTFNISTIHISRSRHQFALNKANLTHLI